MPFNEKNEVLVAVTPQQVGETLERSVCIKILLRIDAGQLYSPPSSVQKSESYELDATKWLIPNLS